MSTGQRPVDEQAENDKAYSTNPPKGKREGDSEDSSRTDPSSVDPSGVDPSGAERPDADSSRSTKGTRGERKETERIEELADICGEILDHVPKTYGGQRQLRYLAEQVSNLSAEERLLLQEQVEKFIRHTIEMGASDMDMGGSSARNQIWFRMDGRKRPDERMGKYSALEADLLILSVMNPQQRKEMLKEGATDFSYSIEIGTQSEEEARRLRATAYLDFDHVALNMRVIDNELFTLNELGFSEEAQKRMMFRHVKDGLTLITGVTGSGKSTTLDAIIDKNNRDFEGHIVIIAEPVEYKHSSKKCIIRHRGVERDVPTFKKGITQALRQDPDIVMIGEIRDPETIKAALEITDSGHKVFSTLHTSSAIETIDRIIAEIPPNEQERVRHRLADVLKCVVSQKLLPKRGGGRQLAKEVLMLGNSAQAAIKNDNVGEVYQMMWEEQNTLEQDLYRLGRARKITASHALDYANNKKRLRRLMN
jgi:twitching motility protein PilT